MKYIARQIDMEKDKLSMEGMRDTNEWYSRSVYPNGGQPHDTYT